MRRGCLIEIPIQHFRWPKCATPTKPKHCHVLDREGDKLPAKWFRRSLPTIVDQKGNVVFWSIRIPGWTLVLVLWDFFQTQRRTRVKTTLVCTKIALYGGGI